MPYYGSAFRELAEDNFGEAAMLRLYLRLPNGSNFITQSGDFDDTDHWTVDGSGALVRSPGNPPGNPGPGFGASHLIAQFSGTSSFEQIYQERTEDRDRFVMSITVHEYATGNTGALTMLHDDTVLGGQQRAEFTWSAGVLSASTIVGGGASGVIDLGDGWYRAWWASATTAVANQARGNAHRYRIYPAYNDSAVGLGVYLAHAQLEMGGGLGGPRTAANLNDGPYAPIDTRDYPITSGGPGELVLVNDTEEIVRANPVVTKRESDFGFVHAQQWQAQFTNETLALGARELSGGYAALQMGFPEADEWALVAQGRIGRARVSSNLLVSIDVDSPMQKLIEAATIRTAFFHPTLGYATAIEPESIDDDSEEYDNEAAGAGVSITAHALVRSRRCYIEFVTATSYRVVDEFGDEDDNGGSNYSIASDATITAWSCTINWEGFDQTASAYAAGDRFYFDLSKRRGAASDLNPVNVIADLITSTEFMGLRAYDVIAGVFYDTPLYEKTAVWDTADAANYSTVFVKGLWEDGTRFVDMVEALLRLINGSIYTMPDGRIALFQTLPNERAIVSLNGNPSSGPVQILEVEAFDDIARVANVVQYKYLSYNTGNEALLTERRDTSPLVVDQIRTVDLKNWQAGSSAVSAAANKLLNRLDANQVRYQIRTTLAGSIRDMDDPVAFTDPMLGDAAVTLIREIRVDAMANEALLSAQLDPVILADYAVVDVSTVGGTDLVF